MPATKNCTKCKINKEVNNFNKQTKSKDSLSRWCKLCCREWRKSNLDKLVETNKKCREKRLDHYRLIARKNVLKQYNMSLEDYGNLLKSQEFKCAICNTPAPGGVAGKFHVDHNHKTLNIRGLLCHHCNKGLGQLKDSVEVLKNAVIYLETAKTSFYKKEKKNG